MVSDQGLVEQIRRQVVEACERNGASPDWSRAIGESVEAWLRREYGGTEAYIHAEDRVRKRAQILDDFDGRNHDEVCEQHGITRRTLHRLVKDYPGRMKN